MSGVNNYHRWFAWVIGILVVSCQGAFAADPPPIRREFRAAWVATVANIDWPSKPGLTTANQQKEMIALLDDAARLNLNAIILQVRPSCDALYESKLEPWSEFLTGKMGQPPEPYYDPLKLAVDEAHKRGLELHVWFNPYRTRSTGNTKPAADNHISNTHPEIVKKYGDYYWLDPGEPEAFEHTMAVIRDVVQRYDIDGVHMDDYFYPYPVQDKETKKNIPFPDEPSWQKAQEAGNQLDRDDWRRENINRLVRRIHEDVRKLKPWVKFGISPFGIGRPGKPPQIKGFDQYESLYADTEKWFKEGWVDYLTPQLYWKIGPPEQSYSALLHWWHTQNEAKRHLWPGNFTSRLFKGNERDQKLDWSPDELIAQIWVTRAQEGATGNVHFSMKALSLNAGGIADALLAGPYRRPALIPETFWLSGSEEPQANTSKFAVKKSNGRWVVSLASGQQKPWLWTVRTREVDDWKVAVVPGSKDQHEISASTAMPDEVVVSAISRTGHEGPLSRASFKGSAERE